MEKGKKRKGQHVLWNKHFKTKMCLQPTTFKCSFVFRLEELLVSQHRNMSFFVSEFDTNREGLLGSDMTLISGSEG